ncbi:MAG: cation-translocating P-type ATPase, partial [Bacillota bacterium]
EIKNKGDKSTFTKIRNIFVNDNKIPNLIGDPTDKALIRVLYKLNFDLNEFSKNTKIIKENEFDSAKRRMSILVKNKNKKELWIKGAVETILSKSTYIQINGVKHKINKNIKEEIISSSEVMANDALRIIAVAYKEINKKVKSNNLEKHENDLIFIGFFALMDPPREEVFEAVQKCKLAGIRSIMVTGDHPLTAKVIAKKVGIIGEYDQVVDGNNFDELTDKQLNTLVKNRRVFARINPKNKLRIVKALQARNEIVAMTGDGVNDAPALQKADIGIAMGKSGSDVSREVASLILTDDNFSTIVAAIEEGRKIYNNIRKFIKYLLSCNIGELLAIFLGICTGLPIPLLAIQILWVNLVTDGLPALALGVEDNNDKVMEKSPRKSDEHILAGSMLNRIIWQGAFIGFSTFLIFLLALFRLNLSINLARTMAFSVLVFSQLVFVFSCRSENNYFWLVNPLSNIFLIFSVIISALMQIAVIYIPQLSMLFKTQILSLNQWLYVIAFSLIPTIILEFFFKKNN